MNLNKKSKVSDSSMNTYSTGHIQFTQNGKPLDYSDVKNFDLTPVESKRLCASIEQFYSNNQLILLSNHLSSILSNCFTPEKLNCLHNLTYTRNGKALDYTSETYFQSLDPTEIAQLCASMEAFYSEKIANIMELITICNTNTNTNEHCLTNMSGHKRKHWQMDGY